MLKTLLIKFPVLSLLFLVAADVHAQGLTRTPVVESPGLLDGDRRIIILIAIRYALVVITLIAGMVALRSGYDWLFAEGSAPKATKAQKTLGKALLIITLMFFFLALYGALVPDYSTLRP